MFSPDSKLIITASDDQKIWFWNVSTGHVIRHLEDHSAVINSAFFSPDGQLVVSASDDRTAQIWPVHIEDLLAKANALIQRDPPILTEEQ